jgi:hypothetical protein
MEYHHNKWTAEQKYLLQVLSNTQSNYNLIALSWLHVSVVAKCPEIPNQGGEIVRQASLKNFMPETSRNKM